MLFKFDFCLIMNFNSACCQAYWLRLSYILRHVFGTESIYWEKHAIQFTHVTVGDCAMHHLIVITHLVVRTSKIGMWEVQESYYHWTKLFFTLSLSLSLSLSLMHSSRINTYGKFMRYIIFIMSCGIIFWTN